MKTIAFYSIKGGVGKSSVAVNIAYLAGKAGTRTLFLDLDAQGAGSFFLNVKPVEGTRVKSLARGKNSVLEQIRASDYRYLDVIPSREGLRNFDLLLDKNDMTLKPLVARLSKDYDLLVIDCPPQIGITGETIFGISDALLVPIVPSALSIRTLDQLVSFFDRKNLARSKIYPFVSMFDCRKKIHAQTAETMRINYPECLGTIIPYSSEFEKMGIRKAPLCHYNPNGKAGVALQSLFEEMRQKELV